MTLIDLPFTRPIVNAPGTLGFDPARRGLDLAGLGGFITNPVSQAPRTAASGPRLGRFPGGLLLHTGHPNPGLRGVLKKYGEHWARAALPVVVHLLAESPDELYRMVRVLEETEGVSGVEIGIPPGVRPELARAFVQAAVGELPVVVQSGLDEILQVADECSEAGASALALGPPRGMLPQQSGVWLGGRAYGPALFPLALDVLQRLEPHRRQVIFSGGVQTRLQIDQALAAGAAAVQLDLLLWRFGEFSAPAESSSAHH